MTEPKPSREAQGATEDLMTDLQMLSQTRTDQEWKKLVGLALDAFAAERVEESKCACGGAHYCESEVEALKGAKEPTE